MNKPRTAFTLLEVIIALMVSGLILAVLLRLVGVSMQSIPPMMEARRSMAVQLNQISDHQLLVLEGKTVSVDSEWMISHSYMLEVPMERFTGYVFTK